MTILVRVPANALIDILFPTLPESPWLDLRNATAAAKQGADVWVADMIDLYEGDQPLPKPRVIHARLTQMPDGSFRTFETALLHVRKDPDVRQDPTFDDDHYTQDEASVDVELRVPIRSAESNFSLSPRFARLGVRVLTSLAFLPPNGEIRQFEYEGDPSRFHLDPRNLDAVVRSVRDGYQHFLSANDYLLLLLSAAFLFQTLVSVTRFAVQTALSQSLAFFVAAFGLWVSSPWAEALWGVLVSAAVAYMAFEAVLQQLSPKGLAAATLVAGFIIGTGFWFAFRGEMQFAGGHKLAAVLAFDLGVQIAQASLLALVATSFALLRRLRRLPRAAFIVGAAIVLRFAWHQMLARARGLRLTPVVWPTFTSREIAAAVFLVLVLFAMRAYAWKKPFAAAR